MDEKQRSEAHQKNKFSCCALQKNDVASKFVLILVFSVEIEEVSKLRRKKPKRCDRCRIRFRFRYRKQNKNNIPIESTSITSHIMFCFEQQRPKNKKTSSVFVSLFRVASFRKQVLLRTRPPLMWAWYHRPGFFDKLTLLRRPRMNWINEKVSHRPDWWCLLTYSYYDFDCFCFCLRRGKSISGKCVDYISVSWDLSKNNKTILLWRFFSTIEQLWVRRFNSLILFVTGSGKTCQEWA